MRSRVPLVTLALAALLTISSTTESAVLHGTVSFLPYYVPGCECGADEAFDFSAQATVPFQSLSADLAYSEDPKGGTWYWYAPRSSVFYYLAATVESLETVPASGTFYDKIQLSGTYVMKTEEGYWVKFTVRDDAFTIEYFVQTDGTTYFGPALAVESSTWGRVKALYR